MIIYKAIDYYLGTSFNHEKLRQTPLLRLYHNTTINDKS